MTIVILRLFMIMCLFKSVQIQYSSYLYMLTNIGRVRVNENINDRREYWSSTHKQRIRPMSIRSKVCVFVYTCSTLLAMALFML
jgi:hypothetical protein